MSVRTLLRRLASPRLAAGLIVALVACLVVSFIVPQRAIVGEAVYGQWRQDSSLFGAVAETLGFADVFSSAPFLVLAGLLALNLAACTARRAVRQRSRRVRDLSIPEDAETLPVARPDVGSLVGAALRSWRVFHPDPGSWLFEGGRVGRLGSLCLHAGLIVVIAAGVVSGLTRFEGTMVITEGQTVVDEPGSYVSVAQSPRIGAAFSGARIVLERLAFTYAGDTVVDAVASMRRPPDTAVQAVRVNEPLRAGGKAYLLSEAGYAVSVRVSGPTGTLLDSTVNLGIAVPEGYRDEVTLSDGRQLAIVAIPSRDTTFGGTAHRRMVLSDPRVRLTAGGGSLQLSPGETGRLGDLDVTLADVRHWNSFLVRADGGLPFAYLGFALVAIGMLARWLDPEVFVAVVLRDGGTEAALWSRSRHGGAVAERALARARRVLATSQGIEE